MRQPNHSVISFQFSSENHFPIYTALRSMLHAKFTLQSFWSFVEIVEAHQDNSNNTSQCKYEWQR